MHTLRSSLYLFSMHLLFKTASSTGRRPPSLSRIEAGALLEASVAAAVAEGSNCDGFFILRLSDRTQGFALSVVVKRRIMNYQINVRPCDASGGSEFVLNPSSAIPRVYSSLDDLILGQMTPTGDLAHHLTHEILVPDAS